VPSGTYFPDPRHALTQKVSRALHRAALAAGDDPARYSFALVRAEEAQVYADADAVFYVTDGLARLPVPVVEAVLAHEVAREALQHVGRRRALSLSTTAGFTVLGIIFPGAGLADFVVNPLLVRAFSRNQEKQADAKAVEILRAMGYAAPRRALALAQRAAGRTAPNPAVGAVVVSRGVVAGEGYHRQAGASHAEVEALRRAGSRSQEVMAEIYHRFQESLQGMVLVKAYNYEEGAIRRFREAGVPPERLVGWLASISGLAPEGASLAARELVGGFRLEKVPRGPVAISDRTVERLLDRG